MMDENRAVGGHTVSEARRPEAGLRGGVRRVPFWAGALPCDEGGRRRARVPFWAGGVRRVPFCESSENSEHCQHNKHSEFSKDSEQQRIMDLAVDGYLRCTSCARYRRCTSCSIKKTSLSAGRVWFWVNSLGACGDDVVHDLLELFEAAFAEL